ncbi:MAG: S8 family peptidase [Clostridia bacterium]|nr:S8 family peptidase [Clostridia bacterium]
MRNLKKLDPRLIEVVSLNLDSKVDCIAYVNDFQKAKDFLSKNEIIAELPFIKAFALKISSSKLFEICNHKWVECVTKQANVLALLNIARNVLGVDSNQGDGTNTIAYIDTGIFPHLDFSSKNNRIIKFVDLINGRDSPYDDNGHGTFVAGAGSGNGFMSGGKYAGMAPYSNIISIKALNSLGEASALKILEAMQWVYDNAKKYNIRVVCMSFGSESLGLNDPIMRGAEVLWNKGITMVAAAGNSGPEHETIKSPGICPNIITVGGLDDGRPENIKVNSNNFRIAEFSSRGPALKKYKPDLIAPAVDIVSCNNIIGNPYTKLSGTSVATPMIAGICSLILDKQPNLSPDAIKRKLITTCTGITFNRNVEGYGYPCVKEIK